MLCSSVKETYFRGLCSWVRSVTRAFFFEPDRVRASNGESLVREGGLGRIWRADMEELFAP